MILDKSSYEVLVKNKNFLENRKFITFKITFEIRKREIYYIKLYFFLKN